MYGLGLGDITCGQSPCSWWDDVYLTQACQDYLMQCDPTSPLLTVVQKGLIVGGAQVAGSTIGTAVGGAVETGIQTTTESLFTNPDTGSMNWNTMGLAIIGGLILLLVLRK